MDGSRIYRKTAKGHEAIQQRTHRLAPRARQVLIMVNGEKSAGTLRADLAALGDIGQYLDELERDGFIEPGSEAAGGRGPDTGWGRTGGPITGGPGTAPPTQPAGGPRTAPAGPGAVVPAFSEDYDFDRLRAHLAKSVLDTLGPFGSSLLEQIGRARKVEDLHAMIPACARAIETSSGKERANTFLAGLQGARR